MIAVFFNQKYRVAKTKPAGHSALKFGREGKGVRLIGIHPQDTGDARSPVNAVDMLPMAQVTGAKFILRLTINGVLGQSSRTKIMAFWHGIAAIGLMRNLPSCACREGAGADP